MAKCRLWVYNAEIFFVASGHPFAPVIRPTKRNSKKCFLGHPNMEPQIFYVLPLYHTSEIIMLEMCFKNYLDSDPRSIWIREGRLGSISGHWDCPTWKTLGLPEHLGVCACHCVLRRKIGSDLMIALQGKDWMLIECHHCICLRRKRGGVILIRWLARVRNGSQVLVSWQRHLKPGALQLPRPNVPLFRILLYFFFYFRCISFACFVFLCIYVAFLLPLFCNFVRSVFYLYFLFHLFFLCV